MDLGEGGRTREQSHKFSLYTRRHIARAEGYKPFISLTSFRCFVFILERVATVPLGVAAFDLSRERRFRYSIICSRFMADQFTIKLKLHASLRFKQFARPSHKAAADYHFIASQ